MEQQAGGGNQTVTSFNGSPGKELPVQKFAGRADTRYLAGMNRNPQGRATKIFADLSMSHEEKALRNNYGVGFDDQSIQQMSSMQSPIKVGRGMYGSKLYKSQGRSTARDNSSGRRTAMDSVPRKGVLGAMGRNTHSSSQLDKRMNDLSQLGPYHSYGSQIGAHDRFLYQQDKLQNSRQRNEAAQQRQATLNAQHQARIQQLVRKAQQKETAMAKRQRLEETQRRYLLEKAKEKYAQSETRKKHLDNELQLKSKARLAELLERQARAEKQLPPKFDEY